MFYENITGKILKQPQLYGTNQQFNAKAKKVMPPDIYRGCRKNKCSESSNRASCFEKRGVQDR